MRTLLSYSHSDMENDFKIKKHLSSNFITIEGREYNACDINLRE